jgi:hypothetical protein
MSRSILLATFAVASAASLAGCGHTVYRETVVEKQPVVTRETVVERPVATAPATIVAVPTAGPACSFGDAAYSSGTMSCQAGYQYQCVNGRWERIAGSSC